MSFLDVRLLYAEVDLRPDPVRCAAAERARHRRARLLAAVILSLAFLLVTQAWQERLHLVDHRDQLIEQHESLNWQLDRLQRLQPHRAALLQRLAAVEAITHSVSYSHMADEVGAALPAEVALRRFTVQRQWATEPNASSVAASLPAHRIHPAMTMELEAVGASQAQLANFVARLAASGSLQTVTVAEASTGGSALDSPTYRIQAQAPFPAFLPAQLPALEAAKREVARSHGN